MGDTIHAEVSGFRDGFRSNERLSQFLLEEAMAEALSVEEDAVPSSQDENVWQVVGEEATPTSLDPYGDGIDPEEAAAVGLHIVRGGQYGQTVRRTGDGYYNPWGNGARTHSAVGGMILAGHDIRDLT